MDLRDQLRMRIEESGLKHKVIADRANLTPQQLCDITSKRRKLEASELFALCEVLGMTPNDFYQPRAG